MNIKYTRRAWTERIASLIAACLLCRETAAAQDDAKKTCEGYVTDRGGKGIPEIEVAIVDYDGGGATAKTDAAGFYRIEAPDKMPYAVIFRDRKGFSTLLDVRGLTPGRSQLLSITIEAQSSYQRGYGTLQAVEAVAALAAAGTENTRTQKLFGRFPEQQLRKDIDVASSLRDVSRRESAFLSAKARGVRALLDLLKSPASG